MQQLGPNLNPNFWLPICGHYSLPELNQLWLSLARWIAISANLNLLARLGRSLGFAAQATEISVHCTLESVHCCKYNTDQCGSVNSEPSPWQNHLTNPHRNLCRRLCHGQLLLCKILSLSDLSLLPVFEILHIPCLLRCFSFSFYLSGYNEDNSMDFYAEKFLPCLLRDVASPC